MSLSRSSSFDWINEPADPTAVDLKSNQFFPDSEFAGGQPTQSVINLGNLVGNLPGYHSTSPKSSSPTLHSSRSTPSRIIRPEPVDDVSNDDLGNMIKRNDKIRLHLTNDRQLR